jgi:hypothetical protein
VTAAGKSDVTFNGDTEIDQIGVTHILKQMTQAGDKAWATESRDHSIDHSLTGYFTQNDVNAYTVTKVSASSTASKTTVRLNAISEDGYVPEETGLVMRLDNLDNSEVQTAFATTNGYDGNAGTGRVPLFYPAMTTSEATSPTAFPDDNLMYKNLSERILDSETETVGTVDYTRFILAKRYMTWAKSGNTVTPPTGFESREAAVFYRLHLYGSPDNLTEADGTTPLNDVDADNTADKLNTLGANKAMLLLQTNKLPEALWNTSGGGGSAPHRYIAIEGVSDMEELEELEEVERSARMDNCFYNLNGQKVAEGEATQLPRGIYIRNGKKIIVK